MKLSGKRLRLVGGSFVQKPKQSSFIPCEQSMKKYQNNTPGVVKPEAIKDKDTSEGAQTQTCDCAECDARIEVNGDNCFVEGVYLCPDCQRRRAKR